MTLCRARLALTMVVTHLVCDFSVTRSSTTRSWTPHVRTCGCSMTAEKKKGKYVFYRCTGFESASGNG
jgi:hypothetical protein